MIEHCSFITVTVPELYPMPHQKGKAVQSEPIILYAPLNLTLYSVMKIIYFGSSS